MQFSKYQLSQMSLSPSFSFFCCPLHRAVNGADNVEKQKEESKNRETMTLCSVVCASQTHTHQSTRSMKTQEWSSKKRRLRLFPSPMRGDNLNLLALERNHFKRGRTHTHIYKKSLIPVRNVVCVLATLLAVEQLQCPNKSPSSNCSGANCKLPLNFCPKHSDTFMRLTREWNEPQ